MLVERSETSKAVCGVRQKSETPVERSRNWLDILREECARTSQARVAERLGCYSAPVINQVLAGTYPGNFKAVQKAVEGAFMRLTVTCPVLGEIPADQCLREQRKDFAASNPQRVALWRACRSGCVNAARQEPLAHAGGAAPRGVRQESEEA